MRSNLELFILALVKEGLATPYQLMARAGISLGGSLPALRRLREADLISESKTMARRAKKFTILPAGRKALVEGLKDQLSSHPTDLESMLRIACLAWMAGSEEDYRHVLKKFSSILSARSKRAKAEATELAEQISDGNAGEKFRWLRVHIEAHRLQAEAKAMEFLSRNTVSTERKSRGKLRQNARSRQ
jgi:DNA-binding PadR family transcriptional regulator